MGTYIVAGVLVIIVVLIIWKLIRDRKNGKTSCGGDCSNCKGGCH